MKKVYVLAVTMGVAASILSAAAVILDKFLPYRIGYNDYPRYLWAERLTEISVGLALLTLVFGLAVRKVFPFLLGLLSLSHLLFIGGVHSGPNPQGWCHNNLRQIDGAKEQFAYERGMTNGAPITMLDISRLIPADQELRCAEGGKYIINSIGNDVRCTLHGTISEMEAAWKQQMKAQQDGAANDSHPFRSETNRMSGAAAGLPR